MTNQEKYDQCFIDSFNAHEDQLKGLEYQSSPLWDSMGHMQLISALEEQFDIMMETDDIVDLSSYKRGMSILAEKYDVQF
ncbi:MAG: acyl carrier protein [Bacteroidales bacterium]|jgi:acyl carrier protein|nr:acyl carrier protein [Bacteroidales bacterium]